MAKVLERLGIAAEVNAQARSSGAACRSASFVVKGEADLAIQQMPELLRRRRAPRSSARCRATCRTSRRSRPAFLELAQADAAKALVRFLQTPESARR